MIRLPRRGIAAVYERCSGAESTELKLDAESLRASSCCFVFVLCYVPPLLSASLPSTQSPLKILEPCPHSILRDGSLNSSTGTYLTTRFFFLLLLFREMKRKTDAGEKVFLEAPNCLIFFRLSDHFTSLFINSFREQKRNSYILAHLTSAAFFSVF